MKRLRSLNFNQLKNVSIKLQHFFYTLLPVQWNAYTQGGHDNISYYQIPSMGGNKDQPVPHSLRAVALHKNLQKDV